MQAAHTAAGHYMGRRAFQAALYSVAAGLILVNNAMMIYEVRNALGISPRISIVAGMVMVVVAYTMIVRAHDG